MIKQQKLAVVISRTRLNRNAVNMNKVNLLKDLDYKYLYITSTGDTLDNSASISAEYNEEVVKLLKQDNTFYKCINLLIFNLYAMFQVLKLRPGIIIVHDSPNLLSSILPKLIYNPKLILDFHEVIWDAGYSKLVSVFFKFNERIFSRFADVAIYPSVERRTIIKENVRGIPHDIVMPNFPKLTKPAINSRRSGKAIYFGAASEITYPLLRDILPKIQYQIDVYCLGNKRNQLKCDLKKYEHIRFCKPFDASERDRVLQEYDFSICVYPGERLNNEYCEPRKLYESILNGLPVVMNRLEGPFNNELTKKFVIDAVKFHEDTVFEARTLLLREHDRLFEMMVERLTNAEMQFKQLLDTQHEDC